MCALIITSDNSFQGDLLSRLLDLERLTLADAQLATSSSIDVIKSFSTDRAGAYKKVVSVASATGYHSHAFVSAVLALLAPGGTFTAHEPQDNAGTGHEDLQKRFLLGGLLGGDTCEAVSPTYVAATGRKSERQAAARSSLLKRKEKRPSIAADTSSTGDASAKPAVWSLALDDAAAPSQAEGTPLPQAAPTSDTDKPLRVAKPCPPTARKACKNCSCGRADAEAKSEPAPKPVLTQAMLDNPQSACGSCGLGDKFRCAGCPYAGLPSFKMGQKIELPTDFLVVDA